MYCTYAVLYPFLSILDLDFRNINLHFHKLLIKQNECKCKRLSTQCLQSAISNQATEGILKLKVAFFRKCDVFVKSSKILFQITYPELVKFRISDLEYFF